MNFSRSPRINLPQNVRDYVLKRDRNQCQGCGKKIPAVKLQIDHIIPLAKGGPNDVSNLQSLCTKCNLVKGDRLDHQFQRRYSS